MVAPEASYEEISGRILQNRDFHFGGKSGWYLLPVQELVLGSGQEQDFGLRREVPDRDFPIGRGLGRRRAIERK